MDVAFFERYQRQIQLPHFGMEAQQKLANAKVLIVGLGGLGCPVAQYLAGAGIGTIGLVDGDQVALHNLHRQPLYRSSDIGRDKSEVAKETLIALNPSIDIQSFNTFISPKTIYEIASDYDYIVDGSDQFATRYLLDQFCTLEQKKYVYASLYQYEGQVALFDYTRNKISYTSLFPHPPKASEVPSCNENGILGFLPAIIGSMQALETVKHICELIPEAPFALIHYNGLKQEIYKTAAIVNTAYQAPSTKSDILNFDYSLLCR